MSFHSLLEDHVFAAGDMAVYPAHGVGLIQTIEKQTIGGIDQSFYVMKILDNDMTIMIPTATSANVGLRAIISDDEVTKVIDILKERDVKVTAQTWNRRYRDYMDKIKTGSVFEVAVVLRDLFLLKVKGDSMVDAAICDGDYVVVRSGQSADSGTIVVLATLSVWPDDASRKPGLTTVEVVAVPVVAVLAAFLAGT